jgi:two-component system sensor histidine kinase YesM
MEKDMISNYNQMLLYSSKNIEMKISEYNQISQLIYNYRSREYGSIEQILENENFQLLEDFLRSTVYSEKHIESAFLANRDFEIFSYFSQNASSFLTGFNLKRFPKNELIEKNKKLMTILPTHEEDYFFRSESTVISFIRNYLDIDMLPLSEEVISIFGIEVNTDFIKEILAPLSVNKEGEVFLLDKEGYLIYQSKEEKNKLSSKEVFNQIDLISREEKSGYISDSEGYLFFRSIEKSDWILIYNIQHSSIFRLINEFKNLGLLLMSLFIITFLFLAMVFSRKLSQPIKNIIIQMKLVESGDLTSEVKVKTQDEIHQLAQAFNRMVRRLNEHINKAYVAQIKQKDTELNAIRTQIRPHYLYNTLEIIRMSALEEDAENTQKMIFALSEQLKYVIGNSGVKVSLKRELDMIRNYFNIVYIRYEQRIRLEVDIPAELYDCEVLKLMIQPIVENAVIHGLKPKKGKGTVKISASIDDDILIIRIIDDGKGIPHRRLEEVQRGLQTITDHTTDIPEENIGLTNVQSRIQLTYGTIYGIHISSKENTGTLTTISIPAEKRKIK